MDDHLLEAVLDSWDRNNTILLNLLRALLPGGLEARASESGRSVAELLTHVHYVRLVLVSEDAPEHAVAVPEAEWIAEPNAARIAEQLRESAVVVRAAVAGRLRSARPMDRHYDHPILLLQHLIWHEGYHHGQIKLALKAAGLPLRDGDIGPLTWGIWMRKG